MKVTRTSVSGMLTPGGVLERGGHVSSMLLLMQREVGGSNPRGPTSEK